MIIWILACIGRLVLWALHKRQTVLSRSSLRTLIGASSSNPMRILNFQAPARCTLIGYLHREFHISESRQFLVAQIRPEWCISIWPEFCNPLISYRTALFLTWQRLSVRLKSLCAHVVPVAAILGGRPFRIAACQRRMSVYLRRCNLGS